MGIDLAGRDDRGVAGVLEGLDQRLAVMRWLSGQQVIEDGAQPVDVGPGVDPLALAAGLLRGHVGWRAGHHVKTLAGDRDRQAEIDEPRHAVVAQDDVLRLDVAVHEAAGVDLGQPPGNLFDQANAAPGVGPFVLRQLGQRTAGHVFHDQVDLVAPGLDPVAGRDERAAHPRQGAALVEHRLAPVGRGYPMVAFEHHQAMQGAVARQISRGLTALSRVRGATRSLRVRRPAPRLSPGSVFPGNGTVTVSLAKTWRTVSARPGKRAR